MWLVISLPTVGGGSRPHQPTYHLTYLEMRSALHGTPPPTPMAFNDRGRLNDKRSLPCFLAFLLSCSASLPATVPDHPPRYLGTAAAQRSRILGQISARGTHHVTPICEPANATASLKISWKPPKTCTLKSPQPFAFAFGRGPPLYLPLHRKSQGCQCQTSLM